MLNTFGNIESNRFWIRIRVIGRRNFELIPTDTVVFVWCYIKVKWVVCPRVQLHAGVASECASIYAVFSVPSGRLIVAEADVIRSNGCITDKETGREG